MKLIFENWRKFLDEERKTQELLKEESPCPPNQVVGPDGTCYSPFKPLPSSGGPEIRAVRGREMSSKKAAAKTKAALTRDKMKRAHHRMSGGPSTPEAQEVARVVASMGDPTGVLSYPDVRTAYIDMKNNPTKASFGWFFVALVAALPVVGYVAKPLKAARLAKLTKTVNKADAAFTAAVKAKKPGALQAQEMMSARHVTKTVSPATRVSKVMGSKVNIIADVNMGGGQKYAIIKGEGRNMAFYESSGASHKASAAGRMNPFGGITPYRWSVAPITGPSKMNRFGHYDSPGTRLVKYVGRDSGEVMQGGKLRRGKTVRPDTELGKIGARLEGVVAGHQDPIGLAFHGTKDPLSNINKGFEKLGKPGITHNYLVDASINQHLKGTGALTAYRGEKIFENAPLIGLDSNIGPTIADMFKALDAIGM